MRGEDALRWTAVAFGGAFLLHSLDHARRGIDASPPAVFVIGTIQGIAVGLVVWMAWTRRAGAPTGAALVGLASIGLVVAGHLTPGHSPTFSDSFLTPPATNVNGLSGASALAEVAAAAGFVGAGVFGRRSLPAGKKW